MRKTCIFLLLVLLAASIVLARNIGSHTIDNCPQSSVILDFSASNKGMLITGTALADTTYATSIPGPDISFLVYNTAIIVVAQKADNQTGNFAAKVCAKYSATIGGITYGNCYLPPEYELNLLPLRKTVIGGFVSSCHWSSSECNFGYARKQYFLNGNQFIST
ncbi:MAG: hypothetical protein WCM93_06970 [Bacteroidota bacterium]